jgi:hypothetical protein
VGESSPGAQLRGTEARGNVIEQTYFDGYKAHAAMETHTAAQVKGTRPRSGPRPRRRFRPRTRLPARSVSTPTTCG